MERNDAEEVTMSKIIQDLFNIPVCLVFYFIDSEKTLKNFKKLTRNLYFQKLLFRKH